MLIETEDFLCGLSDYLGSLTAVFMKACRTRSESESPVPGCSEYLKMRLAPWRLPRSVQWERMSVKCAQLARSGTRCL